MNSRDIALELRCSEEDIRALIREGELRTVACGIRPGLVPRHGTATPTGAECSTAADEGVGPPADVPVHLFLQGDPIRLA